MSTFFYFKEGDPRPISLADVQAMGLGYAFDETPQSSPLMGGTPTGKPGMLIWSQSRLGELEPGYYPDRQTWKPLPGSDGVMVGMFKEHPPTPATLRTTGGMAGEPFVLNGETWIIPRLANHAGEDGFTPAYSLVAELDDDGNWISGGVADGSMQVADLFARLYAAVKESVSGETPLPVGKALGFVVELLAVNYRIGKREAAMLRLLVVDDTLRGMIWSALDWEHAMAWAQKKTQEPSQTGSAG